MPPKKPTLPTPVTAHTHADSRANIPTEELRWGRWAFIEIVDPWDAKNTIQAFLQETNTQ